MRDRVAFANDYKETHERKLKQLNNSRESQKLYNNGKKYANDGFKLEDSENASDIHFQRGFEAAYKEKGFNYGYNAYKEEDVPSEYLENKYFHYVCGYQLLTNIVLYLPTGFSPSRVPFFILFQLRICSKVAKKAATIQKICFSNFY